MTKLSAFMDKVSKNRMVSQWTDREALQAKVIVSLSKSFSDSPRIGWVRADTAANEDVLSDILKYRNQLTF
jgi:hypothetical protein